jgi:surfeit locus 1 family protein
MQKGEPPPSGWPLPDPLPPKLVNNHLGYALTWFGLALALAGVAWAFFRKQQRKSST